MRVFRVDPGFASLYAVLLALVLMSACDGKPCSPPPKYEEYDKEVVDALDDILDDADAYPNQRTKVFAINKNLDKDRAVFRIGYESLRSKLIDQLVAVEPQAATFHELLDDLKKVFMRYVYRAIDDSLPAHRFFTNVQRKAMTEDWEEPPDEYSVPWTTNRAIDVALIEISATDEQKAVVKGLRDKMEKDTNRLLKNQHAVRMKLIGQWHQTKIDPIAVRSHIDEGALQISTFMHQFTDAAFQVLGSLTPQQRLWTNKQVNKLRRCQ